MTATTRPFRAFSSRSPAEKFYSPPSSRGIDNVRESFAVGDKLHVRIVLSAVSISMLSSCQGYEVQRVTESSELNLAVFELRHERTGAQHVHVDSVDPNNVFSVTFKTPPPDSAGVPHILEHTVLCGSERYPVRDPFFNMLNRSVNTFMNAMTASDHTMYPFSSLNEQDFANLLSVYTDAVFFPHLRQLDFRQVHDSI